MRPVATNSATLSVRAGIGGQPVVQQMQASGALAFQAAPWGVWLVGSAAHPIGGDDLHVKVNVGVGCCLDIRSYSATVARRGPAVGARSGAILGSASHTSVNVGSDAVLSWCPEPGIATKGCEHFSDSVVQLASNARLAWREDFLLDRRLGDNPGTWRSRLRVMRDGWPVVASELALGPGSQLWESPAVLEGARAISIYVVVDPGRPTELWQTCRDAATTATGIAMPLAGPGVQLTAWGDDLFDCRAVISQMMDRAGVPNWAKTRWEVANANRHADDETAS